MDSTDQDFDFTGESGEVFVQVDPLQQVFDCLDQVIVPNICELQLHSTEIISIVKGHDDKIATLDNKLTKVQDTLDQLLRLLQSQAIAAAVTQPSHVKITAANDHTVDTKAAADAKAAAVAKATADAKAAVTNKKSGGGTCLEVPPHLASAQTPKSADHVKKMIKCYFNDKFKNNWFDLDKSLNGNLSPSDFLKEKGFSDILTDISLIGDETKDPNIKAKQHYVFGVFLFYIKDTKGVVDRAGFDSYYNAILNNPQSDYHRDYMVTWYSAQQ